MSILGKIRNKLFVTPIVNSIKQEIPGILQRIQGNRAEAITDQKTILNEEIPEILRRIQGNRAEQIQDLRIVLHQELPKMLKSDCLTVDTFFSAENQQNDANRAVQTVDKLSFTDKLDEISKKAVIKTDAEIRKMLSKRNNFSCDKNSAEPKKQCSIFASYSSSGTIEDYVIYYLKELRKVSDYIIFVADNDIKNKKEFEKIRELVDFASFGRHGQYDFGSWKIGYEYLTINNLLDKFDNFLLVNDSCYGPLYPLKDVFGVMAEKKSDFWGLCDSTDDVYHIQSFFINCSRKVFTSKIVKQFFYSMPEKLSFWDAVTYGEQRFTYLLSKEFTSSVLLPAFSSGNSREYIAGNRNGTVYPLTLIKNGFPLIKIKAMTNRLDLREAVSDVLTFVYEANKDLYEIIVDDLTRRFGMLDASYRFSQDATDLRLVFTNQKVISFDIFDTLLVRPFAQPTDLFKLIESDLNIDGFSEERIKAEARARANSTENEITFDEIYDSIKPEFKFVKQIELDYEYNLLSANPAIKPVYEQACSFCGTVIATSDMYLPKDFLKKVLDKNGYEKISAIFVSSENRHTKGSAELYKELLENLNLKPNEVIHFGDNNESDNVVPSKLGIKCFTIKKLVERFKTPANVKWTEYCKNTQFLNKSIHLARLAHAQYYELSNNVPYWQMLGYRLGGPLALSYLNYIINEVKRNKIDRILFVARYGWILKNLYEKYFMEDVKIPCSYIYLQRILGVTSTLNWLDEPCYLKKLLREYKAVNNNVTVTDDYELNKCEFYRYKDEIEKWSAALKIEFDAHVRDAAGDANNIALVDMTTGRFSSENYAKTVLGKRLVLSIFSATFCSEIKNVNVSFLNRLLTSLDDAQIQLSEIMISSPEGNVIGLKNGKPVYVQDENRKSDYLLIAKGIEDYVSETLNMFGKKIDGICFSMEEWLDMASHYKNLKNMIDMDYMRNFYHSDLFVKGESHSLYDLFYN